MNFTLRNIVAIAAFAVVFTSCSNDDDAITAVDGKGEVELTFDNSVNGDNLILGTTYTNSNNETLKINRFSYIVSNFVLIDDKGQEYTYPKDKSYFVISEEANKTTFHLENIPVGNYTKIKFGLGVDQAKYATGELAQQEFWDEAAANNLTWTWSTGYRFINFEGTFSSPAVTGSKAYQVHLGSNSATDNYREVTLSFPTTARVRTDAFPSVHLITDVNKVLDGETKIKLSEAMNGAGTAATIMGGAKLISIANNTKGMFVVDHVHATGH
ncbi:MbnP family protein [Flavobacterium sp. '19STA2R22 D10 B1']|uniref:MbnP family protein n=1 Tax=Flavobacterium aerium TaxID=3037261 RepID=UPI00278BEC24|nr:MbnP family protein [Flavobacterium sp. '19STA2R22 D10 B1']